jgi:hypothetical protein
LEEGPGLSEVASDGPEDGSLDAENSDGGDLVDVGHGPNSAFANCTFDERLSKHIQELRDFCDGLEYQRQFRDQRFLNSLEKDGAGFLRLMHNCFSIERRRNSTRGPNPNTWEPGTANAMFYRTRPRPEDRDT